jgi:GTP-binding protein
VSQFPHARFLLSAAAAAQFPADQGSEIAFAGRSNAGKSSAINALLARRALARTGKTPGQTRLLNFFEVDAGRRVVDLPGYGYASVPERERRKWVPLLEALRARRSLRGLFLIVDARRGLNPADFEVIEWADPSVRPVHVLLSKSDKLTRTEASAVLRTAAAALPGHATAQLFSAHSNVGVEEARELLGRWLAGEDSPRGD